MWSVWIFSMRRWFSRFGTSSSANSSRATSPMRAIASTIPVSASTGRLSGCDWSLAVPPPPTPPSSIPPTDNWNADFASDPGSWENSFDGHWERVEELIEDQGEITYEKIISVFRHLSTMSQLLMMEMNAQPEPAIGPILDRHFTNQIMERIVDWAIEAPQFLTPTCQVSLIRIYEAMVSESHSQNHCLLVHKPMLLPLIRLLEWCRRSAQKRSFTPSNTDKHFVLLLNQICTKMAEDATLLHFFFTFGGECDEQFLVFSLLIPYLYDSGDVGQLARDALLLVLSVSRRLKYVAAFIAIKSNFCPVVATGLSGCYSQLPRNIGSILYVGDDWHKINTADIESYPSLADFHSSLLFCNAVVQVAHEYVVSQIISYIYNGFLLPVVLPSLLQNGQEELISSTAYYHLCVDTVTEPSLIHALIKLLLVEECERSKKIIDVIVERISLGNRLSQVSLSLLQTLIDLRCEDVMLDLVFKYLLPCTFIQPNQTPTLKAYNYGLEAANTLLSCIPECTLKSPVLCSQASLQSYLYESQKRVQLTADACTDTWAWNYDARNPPPAMFRGSSDEDSSTPNYGLLIRQSSARSSLGSSRNGPNRYFVNRGAHSTTDSLTQRSPLPELGRQTDTGQRAPFLFTDPGSPSILEEDDIDELSLPPITPPSIMMTSDYFQFAYDGISESEAEASAARSLPPSNNGASRMERDVKRLEQRKDSSTSGGGGFDTDLEMARSFVLRGWGQVQDLDTFVGLLGHVPSSKTKHSLEENLALVDSRIQYLNELKAESSDQEPSSIQTPQDAIDDGQQVVIPIGRPIICPENQGVGPFLESLLRALESMIDNTLFVNVHITAVISALASYTQPLIASYFFDNTLALRPGVKSLIKILSGLKARIDAYASSVEGFDVLLERGIKFLKLRADRYEKALENSRFHTPRFTSSPRESLWRNGNALSDRSDPPSGLFRFRPFGGSGRRFDSADGSHPHAFRYFSHKAMESRDTMLDHARAKQIVFAAILLSQFCQELAAIVLQHATVVPRPKSRPADTR
uniref:FHF complex subunit HOOK-interacting protein C-terminal domain-containing protein n=1 Tax=Ascaris suum TaxID=6253 RepID=F1KTT5_ASCSU